VSFVGLELPWLDSVVVGGSPLRFRLLALKIKPTANERVFFASLVLFRSYSS
jgi:hypothetical protein